jgi:uncharacterized protein YqeY
MNKIAELTKEKMMCRKTDPTRSSVLGTIISGAKAIAKVEGRECAEWNDVVRSAKSNVQSLNNACKKIMKSSKGLSRSDAQFKQYDTEISISREFLPPPPTTEQIEVAVDEACNSLPVAQRNKQSFRTLMNMVKDVLGEDVDGSILAEIITRKLS